jgi:hypothetical protein
MLSFSSSLRFFSRVSCSSSRPIAAASCSIASVEIAMLHPQFGEQMDEVGVILEPAWRLARLGEAS